MAKFPREEISYKKIYKNLDLDRKLNIKWPKIELPKEIVYVDENVPLYNEKDVYIVDEYDEKFCLENNLDLNYFSKIFFQLDKNFKNYIFEKIKKIKIFKEEEPCDICGLSVENDNKKFVICQGCGLNVHDDCYGVPELCYKIWLCRKCIFYSEEGVCKLCESYGGALKKTNTGDWCHIVCASLMPEASFSNILLKEPIELDNIKPYEGTCFLCNKESKMLIKCSYLECKKLYHTKCCAEKFYSDLNNQVTYCYEHDPLKWPIEIKSRRNLFKDSEYYPELKNKIQIREVLPFFKNLENDFLKIVKSDPIIIFCEKNNKNEKIFEYWLEKRKIFGYIFDDMFIFSNYYLENA